MPIPRNFRASNFFNKLLDKPKTVENPFMIEKYNNQEKYK